MKKSLPVLPAMAALLLLSPAALAQDGLVDLSGGYIGIAAGITMGLAVLGGAIGQGIAARAAFEGIARNPQASGKVTVPMFAGLAFIESLVILAFVIAFQLQGKI